MKSGLRFRLGLFICIASFAGCSVIQKPPTRRPGYKTVEVAVFEGGFGIDWHKKVAREYEKRVSEKHILIDLWGDPRVSDKLQPRILRNSPPDASDSIGPIWRLIVANKFIPLDSALASPAVGQPDKTWRETFLPGVLDSYSYGGKVYAVPLQFSCFVIWYNMKMFEEHGWQVPKTWVELEELCDRIKAAGIAPFAFQGKYPGYAWGVLLSIFQRIGGMKAINRLDNIEPGAFTNPDFVRASSMMQNFAVKYFQPGSHAMSHTEAQMEFVTGRAAMVACGLWLENEMRGATPEGFQMACFPVPTVEGGRGDPNMVIGGGGEMFFVFVDARYPKEATDFIKYMLSLENGRDFSRVLGTISAIVGATRKEDVSPSLARAVEMMDKASGAFDSRLNSLYVEWGNEILPPSLSRLLKGEITPEKFSEMLEEGMAVTRRDPEIYKPPPLEYKPPKGGYE